jgi:hypothetical protein
VVIRLRPRDRPQLILHGGDALGVVVTAPLGAAETKRPTRLIKNAPGEAARGRDDTALTGAALTCLTVDLITLDRD